LLLLSFLAAPASALDRDHLDVEVARIAAKPAQAGSASP